MAFRIAERETQEVVFIFLFSNLIKRKVNEWQQQSSELFYHQTQQKNPNRGIAIAHTHSREKYDGG